MITDTYIQLFHISLLPLQYNLDSHLEKSLAETTNAVLASDFLFPTQEQDLEQDNFTFDSGQSIPNPPPNNNGNIPFFPTPGQQYPSGAKESSIPAPPPFGAPRPIGLFKQQNPYQSPNNSNQQLKHDPVSRNAGVTMQMINDELKQTLLSKRR